MEYRSLGGSGLKVPVLAFGTATFGGGNEFFRAWGSTGVDEAARLLDIAIGSGINFFDTSDVYSDGLAEEILSQAIGNQRNDVLIATKAAFRSEIGPNGLGTSRHHLIRAVEASLRRLRTDWIDVYQLHGFDAQTPVEETLSTLDHLVRSGKVRYIGCSNFSGWHLMKSLGISEKHGYPRYVSYQGYYSLVGRDYEWELMPLALDQKVGTIVWSGLAGGRLTGKVRRGSPLPPNTRAAASIPTGPPIDEERLYNIIDVLDALAKDTGKTQSQIALNWLLGRPSVCSVIVGARNEAQLREHLGALEWRLAPEQVKRLDEVSDSTPPYPYWHQRSTLPDRNPRPV